VTGVLIGAAILHLFVLGCIGLGAWRNREGGARWELVLELLASGGEWRGLDLVHASMGLLKRGTVYVLLARMEDRGVITSEPKPRPGLPGYPARWYRLTEAGRGIMKARGGRT
jgi:DNA-binding PadR family transcriptional regulator